jgi:DNA polymerase type B, organellar and viral
MASPSESGRRGTKRRRRRADNQNRVNGNYDDDDDDDDMPGLERQQQQLQREVNVEDTYRIVDRDVEYYSRFRTHVVQITLEINFSDLDTDDEKIAYDHRIRQLTSIFNRMLGEIKESEYEGNIKVGMYLTSPEFSKGDLFVTPKRLSQIRPEHFVKAVGEVYQSNKGFILSERSQLGIVFYIIALPTGAGKMSGRGLMDIDEFLRMKKCIIKNKYDNDNLCLLRAIVIGLYYEDLHTRKSVLQNEQFQRLQVLCLADRVGIDLEDIGEKGMGIEHLKKIQSVITNRRIVVFVGISNEIIFDENKTCTKILPLLLAKNHYYFISSIKALRNSNYVCDQCLRPFDKKNQHRCLLKVRCKACYTIPACTGRLADNITCPECESICSNDACFQIHKKRVCSRLWKCKECSSRVPKSMRKKHQCGKTAYCSKCKLFHHISEGYCTLQPFKPMSTFKKIKRNGVEMILPNRVVYYDIESVLKSVGGKKKHVPVCLCSRISCNECSDREYDDNYFGDNIDDKCAGCGVRAKTFFSNNPVEEFLEYLFSIARRSNIITCVAHFAKQYDSQFIMNALISKNLTPDVIMRGSMLYSISVSSRALRFIDFGNFFPIPLSKFCSTFGLQEDEFTKGFFPYSFAREDNLDYVGPYPPESDFKSNWLNEADYSEFQQWYENNKSGVFNLRYQMQTYCAQDVKILERGGKVFQQLYQSIASFSPLENSISISSATMNLYRAKFLKQHEIVLMNSKTFRTSDIYSNMGVKYLQYLSKKNGVQIRHALNGGEYIIASKPFAIKVDGYSEKCLHVKRCDNLSLCDRKYRTIYNILGCYFHGCPICYPEKRYILRPHLSYKSYDQLYQESMKKIQVYYAHAEEVINVWTHEIDVLERHDSEYKEWLQSIDGWGMDKLDIRSAYSGGRVECFQLKHQTDNPDEMLRYYDITGMYSGILRDERYPVGYPTFISTFDSNDISSYFGIIKAKVLPPTSLLIPLLWSKHGNEKKLLFPLCRTCADERDVLGKHGTCAHSDEERALYGVWPSMELQLAVSEEGYQIMKIYNVIHFESSIKYDKQSNQHGLFSEFILQFLKLRTESSGFPSWVKTEEDKDLYVQQFYEREGVQLEKNKIALNEPMRNLAKIKCNALYGKFGQKVDLKQTRLIKSSAKFFELLSNPAIKVQGIVFLSQTIVLVSYTDRAHENTRVVSNPIIAAFVTSYSRIFLYRALKYHSAVSDPTLGRIYYCDTDSIVCKGNSDYFKISTYLLEWKNELGDSNYAINKWVSCGPKSYSFQVVDIRDGKIIMTVTHCKGIRINLKNSKIINLESMLSALATFGTESPLQITVSDPQFVRKHFSIYTEERSKIFRVTFDKRIVPRGCTSAYTLPFGYRPVLQQLCDK